MKTSAEINAVARQLADAGSNTAAVVVVCDLYEGGEIVISAVAPNRPSIIAILQRALEDVSHGNVEERTREPRRPKPKKQ